MRKTKYYKYISFLSAIVLMAVWCTPAAAITLKEEEELAREFMRFVMKNFDIIDDPLIVDYVNQVGRKILAQIPPQPFEFRFYVIKEDVYNAFAIPAGHIFINSGLLVAMDGEDELAGILSHEIAHVVCRHISQRIERSKKINIATMAGVFAGIFLGAATGNAEAMQAITIGSAAAGQTATLAYSREDEAQADQIGLGYLNKAGYDSQGLLTVLKKIRGKQWFDTKDIPSYMMTHPAVEERIAKIDADMAVKKRGQKPQTTPPPPNMTDLFPKISARIIALYNDQSAAIGYFQSALEHDPDNPLSAYGYGLTLARLGRRSEALTYLNQALAKQALDPVILSDIGRIYFQEGRFEEALSVLEGAVSLSKINPEGLFYLGRTQMELGRFSEAAGSFENLIKIYPEYRPTYQFLGEIYGKLDRIAEAHYYLGLFHFKKGDFRVAHYHLTKARNGIQEPGKLEAINKALKTIGKLPNNPS